LVQLIIGSGIALIITALPATCKIIHIFLLQAALLLSSSVVSLTCTFGNFIGQRAKYLTVYKPFLVELLKPLLFKFIA